MSARLVFTVLLMFLISCSEKEPEKDTASEGTYFSIMQFAKDQWDTHKGQPFGIKKTVYLDGAADSTVTNAFELDWAPILKVFFETDISDKKFIGQYNFSAFRGVDEKTNGFYYEAKNPKLYTKKLQITAHDVTGKIQSIYIEAGKSDRMGSKNLKLFYTPLSSITIQEMETSRTGQKKELRVVYEIL